MALAAADRYRQVAALHAANIDQGFLATLGIPFLALMYESIHLAEDSVLLTEEQDGRVLGFVSGGLGMGPIHRHMLRSPLRMAWTLFPSLLRPRRVKRILDILRYSAAQGDDSRWPRAELLSIAVDPSARGTGVAERLYRLLESHFRQRGVPAFRIIVGESLAPALRFYERMGAGAVGRIEVHAGEWSTVFVQRIATAPVADALAGAVVSPPAD